MTVDRLMALLERLIGDYELRSRYILYGSLIVNLVYAAFKLTMGIIYNSYWFVALGIYYSVLACMKFGLTQAMNGPRYRGSLGIYQRTAWGLLILTLSMSGVFIQVTLHNHAFTYPGVIIYAMALYTFVKITVAVINLVKRRRDGDSSYAAGRCISFAAALMSLLALQTALLNAFGEDAAFEMLMNGLSGGATTLLLIALSIWMLRDPRYRET